MKLMVILDNGDSPVVEREGHFAVACAEIARNGVTVGVGTEAKPGMEFIPGRRVRKVRLVTESNT